MSMMNFGKLATAAKLNANAGDIQHVSTVSWAQHSDSDDLDQNYYGPPAPDGWVILQSTVKFIIEWQQGTEGGEWGQNVISYNPVGFHVWTQHHRFGTSGKVNFHFEYDLQKV